ncbi:MAG: hypothetical protein ACREBU_21520, partial [Nitrososphaera sp.]
MQLNFTPDQNMPTERVVLDSDLRYLDGKGNLLRSRAEFSLARTLSFLGHDYEYDVEIRLAGGGTTRIDFRVDSGKYIEVVDSEADAAKFRQVR